MRMLRAISLLLGCVLLLAGDLLAGYWIIMLENYANLWGWSFHAALMVFFGLLINQLNPNFSRTAFAIALAFPVFGMAGMLLVCVFLQISNSENVPSP